MMPISFAMMAFAHESTKKGYHAIAMLSAIRVFIAVKKSKHARKMLKEMSDAATIRSAWRVFYALLGAAHLRERTMTDAISLVNALRGWYVRKVLVVQLLRNGYHAQNLRVVVLKVWFVILRYVFHPESTGKDVKSLIPALLA